MSNTVRWKHRVEYALFRAFIAGGERLSDENAARVGEILGAMGYPLGIRKQVVERNLRIAYPEAGDERIREIARAAYAHLGRETLMMLRLSTTTRAQLIARTRMVNEEAARAAWEQGRGVVIVAGHLGNWELGAAMIAARGYPIDIIAKKAANPLFYRRILAARARLGVGVIDFKAASKQALRALRAGRMVAFAADQWAGPDGLHVPFFARPASTYRGAALMALRAGSPMFLTVPLRMVDGTYEMRWEPIEVAPTGNLDADVYRVTAEYARVLEQAVRSAPEQYLWHHRRWRG